MRTLHLKSFSNSGPEFAAVNNDRIQTNTSIEIFKTVCNCGAVGLYSLEVAHGAAGSVSDLVSQVTKIECLSGCGAVHQIMIPHIHVHHGMKLTLLESWRRDVAVDGLGKDEPVPEWEPSQDDIIMGTHSRGRNDYFQIYKDKGGQVVFRLEVIMSEHQVIQHDVRAEIKSRINELLHNYPRSWLP